MFVCVWVMQEKSLLIDLFSIHKQSKSCTHIQVCYQIINSKKLQIGLLVDGSIS